MIAYGKQHIDADDIAAVTAALKSDYLTQGPIVKQFEQVIADYNNFKYCVSFNSATSALHCACLALGINNQSHVWVAANSFVASANCAEYCQASVSFIDTDIETGQLDLDILEKKLREHKKNKQPLPSTVIVVNYAGQLCNMKKIRQLANEYYFTIIEDASHALGASEPSGWNKQDRGEIIVYSFHPIKMITSAEGGAAITQHQHLEKAMRNYANHGISKDKTEFLQNSKHASHYEQHNLGFNYRLSELHAALGLAQLKKLQRFIEKRRQIADFYDQQLQCLNIKLVNQKKYGISSYHLYPILLPVDQSIQIAKQLTEHGIMVQKHYIPIPSQPYYQSKYGYSKESYKQSELFYQQMITLPIYVDLTKKDQIKIISVLKDALENSH